MTKKQRILVGKWAIVGAVLIALVVFDDFIAANASWLRWIAFFFLIVASLVEGFSMQNAEAGRERLAEIVDDAPWLKVWLGVCALAFFSGSVYVTHSSIRLEDVFGFKIIVIALMVLVGPLIVVSERRRYKELGDYNNAT